MTSYIHEQQKEFKRMLPRLDYVLETHKNILQSDEIECLNEYRKFITNELTMCSNTVVDKARTIIYYLERV